MSHKAHMTSSHSFGRDLHMINAANMAMNAHLHAGNNVHHLQQQQQQQQHHQPTNLSIGSNQQNVSSLKHWLLLKGRGDYQYPQTIYFLL